MLDVMLLNFKELLILIILNYFNQPRESPWGSTQFKEGLELSIDEYDEIDQYCKEKGILVFILG